jgi:EAL domain-containing protein (putative c-di-GMP-specific phosphodiesterase class I)
MRDEEGHVSPTDFMQAAERYHLMPNVDRWVLQATFAAIGSGVLKLPDRRSCTINLSGQTIGDPQFLDFVVDALDHSGVAASQICFEVRESAVTTNLSHAARFIAVLHGMGCEFALDDFGSGLGSFANLKSLSMDYLKIDGAIIRGLGGDDVNEAMVSAMIKLASTLNIRVVAEHVETEVVFDKVRQMGVDFVQGYAVGRPTPLQQQ